MCLRLSIVLTRLDLCHFRRSSRLTRPMTPSHSLLRLRILSVLQSSQDGLHSRNSSFLHRTVPLFCGQLRQHRRWISSRGVPFAADVPCARNSFLRGVRRLWRGIIALCCATLHFSPPRFFPFSRPTEETRSTLRVLLREAHAVFATRPDHLSVVSVKTFVEVAVRTAMLIFPALHS